MADTPTTWISRPVCATDEMIEAGALALLGPIRNPAMFARDVVARVWTAMSRAAPKPPMVSAWQDIASAPKGEVLLYFPPKPMGRHTERMQGAMYRIGRADEYPRRPTHWQLLPDAPAIGDAGHG